MSFFGSTRAYWALTWALPNFFFPQPFRRIISWCVFFVLHSITWCHLALEVSLKHLTYCTCFDATHTHTQKPRYSKSCITPYLPPTITVNMPLTTGLNSGLFHWSCSVANSCTTLQPHRAALKWRCVWPYECKAGGYKHCCAVNDKKKKKDKK